MSNEEKPSPSIAIERYILKMSETADNHSEKNAASLLAYTGLVLIFIGLGFRAMPLIQIEANELITLFILGFLLVGMSAATRIWLYKEETKRYDLALGYERKVDDERSRTAAGRSDSAQDSRREAKDGVG
jgi:hypothetical protein